MRAFFLFFADPYLIRLKLGHNNFSEAGIAQICQYAQMRNPYLFHPGAPTLQSEFSAPVSLYGANNQGARTAPATECWVVHAEPVNGASETNSAMISHK
jgi:hypothetical protein